MNATVIAYGGLAVLAGAMIPVMAKANASLATAYGNVPLAAFILLFVGMLAAGVVVVFSGTATQALSQPVPFQYYLAGLVVTFYILSVTFLVPRFGIGNTIIFIVAAQVFSAALIDHFGWLHTPISPITLKRLLGIAVICLGVYWAKS